MTANEIEEDFDYYRDPVTEQWIATWPVQTSRLTRIRIDQIDMKASRDYQNRAGAQVNEEHVDSLALALGNPEATVPPIVLRATQTGRMVIIDGNHRTIGAQRANRETLLAYILTCDTTTAHQMAIAANARNALSLTDAEKQILIAKMVAQGIPQVVVAAQWGVAPAAVSSIVRARMGDDKLREAGVAQPERLPKVTRAAAARLDVEDLLAISARALKDASGSEMEDAVREVLAAKPSERLAMARGVGERIIAARAKRSTPTGRKATGAMGTTPAKFANQVNKLREYVVDKPSLLEDDGVRKALDAFLMEVK